MTAELDCFVDHTVHSSWQNYVVYVPGMFLGSVMCFTGFRMSRSLRFLFGVCFGCYVTLLILESNVNLPEWIMGIIALSVGCILGLIIKTRYRLAIVLLGFCFGVSVAFVSEILFLVLLWCGSERAHGLFYGVLGIAALASTAINTRISSKRIRRHVVIWNSSFAGAVGFVQSLDIFIGNYWNVSVAARCACHGVGMEARIMCGGVAVICVLGLGVQYGVWYRGRKLRHDTTKTIEAYTI